MALDMANFAIEIAKPDIIAHSVDYERKKFADYLSVQPGMYAYKNIILFLLKTIIFYLLLIEVYLYFTCSLMLYTKFITLIRWIGTYTRMVITTFR